MKVTIIEYPKCSTCQKAKKWLEQAGITYQARNIVENNPTALELKLWLEKSNLPIQKLFNTSGLLYKSMNLKELLPNMDIEEKIALLSTNGMLVKRPIIVTDNLVLFGFKEKEWEILKDL